MSDINKVGYLYYGPERLNLEQTAKRLQLTAAETEKRREYYVQFRSLFEKGYYIDKPPPEFIGWKGYEIIVPAWNDIIHIAGPPSYSSYELATIKDVWTRRWVTGWDVPQIAAYMDMSVERVIDYLGKYQELKYYDDKKLERALDLQRSPTPEIAKNFGLIMTAIDDTQDFATTVGVISRALGRIFKPAELLAIGAFTVGELLNRLSLMRHLTGGEKAVICTLVRELKKSSTLTTIKADVHKRMGRLFPSKGEMFEVAQTTDQMFGIGISFGPLIGLAEDLFFGLFKRAPIRFKEWTVSPYEQKALESIWSTIMDPELALYDAALNLFKYAESAANVLITSTDAERLSMLQGAIAYIGAVVNARCTKIWDALVSSWEIVEGKPAVVKKKTSTETRMLIQKLGGDPYSLDSWPVPGLGSVATIREIMDAYSAQGIKVLEHWRNKLGVSDDGIFFDACVKEIASHGAAMFVSPEGEVKESLDKTLLIYIHALEAGLEPPKGTSEEKLTEWHDWILGRLVFFGISVPPLEILKEAFHRFFSM